MRHSTTLIDSALMSKFGISGEVAARLLQVGDVVSLTHAIKIDHFYSIESGARFVVVKNDLMLPSATLSLRLAPDDKGMLTFGDLSGWGDCIELYGTRNSRDVESPAGDLSAFPLDGVKKPEAELPLSPDNTLLSAPERLAAVFTCLLAQSVGNPLMRTLSALNEKDPAPHLKNYAICDFSSFEAGFSHIMKRRNFSKQDCAAGACTVHEYKDDLSLVLEALKIAKKKYVPIYARPAKDEISHSVFYKVEKAEAGEHWSVVRHGGGGIETVAGTGSHVLGYEAALQIMDDLNTRRLALQRAELARRDHFPVRMQGVQPAEEALRSQEAPRSQEVVRAQTALVPAQSGSSQIVVTPAVAALLAPAANRPRPALVAKPLSLAEAMLELLDHIDAWDITDPDHPVARARLAYHAATGRKALPREPGPLARRGRLGKG